MTSKSLLAGKRAEMEDYEASYDLDTLLRAKEIQRDPKRMAAVKKCAAKRIEKDAAKLQLVKALAK